MNVPNKLEYLNKTINLSKVFLKTITVFQQFNNQVKILLKDGTIQRITGYTLDEVYSYIKSGGKEITNTATDKFGFNVRYPGKNSSFGDQGHGSISYGFGATNNLHDEKTLHYYAKKDPITVPEYLQVVASGVVGKTQEEGRLNRFGNADHVETVVFAMSDMQNEQLKKSIAKSMAEPPSYSFTDMNCMENHQKTFSDLTFKGEFYKYIEFDEKNGAKTFSLPADLDRRNNIPGYALFRKWLLNVYFGQVLTYDKCDISAFQEAIDVEADSAKCYENVQKKMKERINSSKDNLPMVPLVTSFCTNVIREAFKYPTDPQRDTSNDKIPQYIGMPLSTSIEIASRLYYFSQGPVQFAMYESLDAGAKRVLNFKTNAPGATKKEQLINATKMVCLPTSGLSIATCLGVINGFNPVTSIATALCMCGCAIGGQRLGREINGFLYPKNAIVKQPQDSVDAEREIITQQPQPNYPRRTDANQESPNHYYDAREHFYNNSQQPEIPSLTDIKPTKYDSGHFVAQQANNTKQLQLTSIRKKDISYKAELGKQD